MAHKNIALFIPHMGCPHQCSFCNQHTISGAGHAPTVAEVQATCEQAMCEICDKSDTEIAFFGGSFTAIDRSYMHALLAAVQPYLGKDGFCGVRISTRPDCIDMQTLELLRTYGVTAIELGAQSLSDSVLEQNERGHSAAVVAHACNLIRSMQFSLGLQIMVGLYGSTMQTERQTMQGVLRLRPDTVRIYPTVILRGTKLAALYERGVYVPFSMQEAIACCAEMLEQFTTAGIRVIRCGLHASELVEAECVGGLYHPAFRELCDTLRYRRCMETALQHATTSETPKVLLVHPSCIGKAVGYQRQNLEYFAAQGIPLKIRAQAGVAPFACRIAGMNEKENSCT